MTLPTSNTGAKPSQAAADPAAAASPEPLHARRLVPALVFAAFGIYFASLTPTIATLAIRIAGLDSAGRTVSLSFVALTGGVATIVALPLFGSLSDRTRGRFGRRRPWLVGGAVAGLAGLVVAGSLDSVAGVLVGWTIASLGYGAAIAGLLPLISEMVPDRLRAKVSALIGLTVSLGVLAGIALGSALMSVPLLMLALPGVCTLPAVLVLARVIRSADRPAASRSPFGLRDFARCYWLRTDGDRDFAWNLLSRFLMGLALVGAQTYATYFLTDAVGLSVKEAARQYAQTTGFATPLSIVCVLSIGFLSDRLGRRKAFVGVGSLIMGAALVITAVTQSVPGFLVAWLVFTVGQSLYLTVDLAIAAAVVPDKASAGKAMSVYQTATLLPQVVAPLVAVAVLTLPGGSNYPLFFLVLAAFAALGGAAVLPIRKVR